MATWKRILVEGDVTGDGVISVSSSAPHIVSLGDPTTGDTALTTLAYNNVAADDYLLIFDNSADEWKKTLYTSIPNDNDHLGNSNLTQSDANRTFDIASGGSLKFIGNSNGYLQFDGENSSGTKNLEVKLGSAVEAFSDDSSNFGGIVVSSSSSTSGTDFGLWLEGGYHNATSASSPLLLAFERSYKTNTAAPGDGDVIGNIEFMAPYYTGSAWVTGTGSTFYDGEGARYAIISGGILSKTSPTKGYLDLKLRNEITLSNSSSSTEESAVLRVDSNGVKINASETYDGTDGTATTATNNDYYLATDRGSSGQVLYTNGSGTTYWGNVGPTVDYTSEYSHADVSTTDLPWTTATLGSLVAMNFPDTTDSGVEIVEGSTVQVDAYSATDVVEFTVIPSAASSGNITIMGGVNVSAQTSGSFTFHGYFEGYDSANDIVEYDGGSSGGYVLFNVGYGATGGTSGVGEGVVSIPFQYTIPQIGTVSGDAITKLKFYFKARRASGSGTHQYKIGNIKITLSP